jgi:hypothetical protein
MLLRQRYHSKEEDDSENDDAAQTRADARIEKYIQIIFEREFPVSFKDSLMVEVVIDFIEKQFKLNEC